LIDGKPVHPGTPEQMAKEAPNWVEAGARVEIDPEKRNYVFC